MKPSLDELKKVAAERAVEEVRSGMAIGLGTGSTATHAVNAIGRKVQSGELTDLVAIPTSSRTAELASNWGIRLVNFNTQPSLDLTIDGADEIDPNLNLIKGLGGALLWEKIVAIASKRMIVISDDSKRVSALGEKAPVPVEVIPFAAESIRPFLESLGAMVVLRHKDGETYYTDEKNFILDCTFGPIDDPYRLAREIKQRPGVVEHGMFLELATEVYVAGVDGVTHLVRD